jgi:tetratricopeptide (TPR) repeat protein
MKHIFLFVVVSFFGVCGYAEAPPDWFLPLRDAVYEQTLTSAGVFPIYTSTKQQTERMFSGAELDAMLSHCEYLMARVYQYEQQNKEALNHYEKGIELAEQSIKQKPTALAYQMLASNISQICMLKSEAWVMLNGLKVESNAKKALQIDPKNAACQYMIAARWVFAPGILGNPERGIREMTAILNGDFEVQKDDLFNVWSAIGHGYTRQKKYKDALYWLEKSLEVYPTNSYVKGVIMELK